MSIKTWKDEFYPEEASYGSDIDSLNHALKKWIGLREENLKKHSVQVSSKCLFDHDQVIAGFNIDSSTCSLCMVYLKESIRCEECPLYKQRGLACDSSGYTDSPYRSFYRHKNPEPMIALIESAIRSLDVN